MMAVKDLLLSPGFKCRYNIIFRQAEIAAFVAVLLVIYFLSGNTEDHL